jgi:hypothetical protein
MPNATESQDPLVRLGLIDVSRIDVHDHPEGEEVAPAPQQPQTPQTPTADWESDENPYKQAVGQLQREQPTGPSLNEQIAAVRAKAAELMPAVQAQLIAMGTSEEHAPRLAADYVNSQAATVISELQRQNDRQIVFRTGAIQRAAAEKIVREMSTKEVKLKVEELVNEPTVEAMQTRARTLIEERRGRNFTERTARGADRAEGGSTTGAITAEVLDKLSPEQKIAYGIKHGQY